MLKIASRDPKLVVKRDHLDQQPTLLPCLNGTVDLTTGELRDAKREGLLSRVVPVEYDPKATAPLFEKFLRRIRPEREMRDFLQRLLGYGLFGFVREHVFPIFYGDGANGKSVLAQAVQHVVGEYSQTVPRTLVVETGHEQHKTQIARLHRTRMGFIHEPERDARLNVEAVKMLTGGDVLTGHFMRKDFFDFMPSHALYLLSNWKPQVDAAMRAVWRRRERSGCVPTAAPPPAPRRSKLVVGYGDRCPDPNTQSNSKGDADRDANPLASVVFRDFPWRPRWRPR